MAVETALQERVTRIESALETERPHLATKADLERQTRLIIMWLISTQIAMAALLIHLLS